MFKTTFNRRNGSVRVITATIMVTDWVSTPGGGPRRMSREYAVIFDSRSPIHLPTTNAYRHTQQVRYSLSWSEVLSACRGILNRGRLEGFCAFLVAKNGGYSERICREVNAAHSHLGLQGHGAGR